MRIKERQTVIFGLKKEGKSNLLQYLLTRPAYENHLVYDLNGEHSGFNRYMPTHHRGEDAETELNELLRRNVTAQDRDRRPEVVAVEELSRFCSPRSPPPEELYELIDRNRHYGVGLVLVARRPAQVHTDVTELADNVLIFPLAGANDRRKLNRMVEGLGDLVLDDLDRYHFARVSGREVTVHSPVPEMDTTGRL
jgi:hypothetical protein